ncbi:hypothetical protein OF829_12110 [Sphingomonas sp. LB-2]|uniref:hypothetical protein n=1 Tax=Sphingomonas caeni TaxID=2984949 RepID=UPI00222EB856|nr:hypothetical protein [Sphingomonas caeni]MCW3847984.1 hypothetical protein [Sphingomonas caeni]
MRIAGMVAGLAIAFAALPAQAQWSDVEGGKRHDKSGLVCPAKAGGFELKTQVATDTGFSCRYELHCSADEGCEGAVGYAAVTWNPAMDFAGQFRSLAAQQKLPLVDEAGPAWAGPPRLFARAGEGLETGYGGWWVVQSHGRPLNIGIFYNAAAEPGARALAEATVRANP